MRKASFSEVSSSSGVVVESHLGRLGMDNSVKSNLAAVLLLPLPPSCSLESNTTCWALASKTTNCSFSLANSRSAISARARKSVRSFVSRTERILSASWLELSMPMLRAPEEAMPAPEEEPFDFGLNFFSWALLFVCFWVGVFVSVFCVCLN